MKTSLRKLICSFICAALALGAFALPAVAAVVPGDTDGDGKITGSDARYVLMCATGEETCDPESDTFKGGDVTGDGRLTAADVRLMMRQTLKMDEPDALTNPTGAVFDCTVPQSTVPEARLALRVKKYQNDVFTVAVVAEHCAGLTSADLTVAFDTNILSLKSKPNTGTDLDLYNGGVDFQGSLYRTNDLSNQGIVRISLLFTELLPDAATLDKVWTGPSNIKKPNLDEFELFTFEFRVKDPENLTGKVTLQVKESGGVLLAAQTETALVLPDHTHRWERYGTIQPTCATGCIFLKCSICGETKTSILPPVKEKHNWEADYGTRPTQTKEGLIGYICFDCSWEKVELYTKLSDPAGGNILYARSINNVITVDADRAYAGALEPLAAPGSTLMDDNGNPIPADHRFTTGDTFHANEYRYTVIILGDVDGDGSVSSSDARLALRLAVQLEVYDLQKAAACITVNKNDITAADARAILRAAVKLEKMQLS